jgi:ATP-dependent Clp protease ATP-binding subunit ClpA
VSADQRTEYLDLARSFYDRFETAIAKIDLSQVGVSADEMQLEVSQYLFDLFAVVSSLDGSTDREEIDLYSTLTGISDPDYSELFAYSADVQAEFPQDVPNFLRLAAAQDQRDGGALAAELVACMTGIAYAVTQTDQQSFQQEQQAVDSYTAYLESFLSESQVQTPDAPSQPRRRARSVSKSARKPSGNENQSLDAPPRSLESLLKELDEMVGLISVKREIHSLVNLLRIQSLRESHGLNAPIVSLHMVFAGNPGTGKTTVARLLAAMYGEIGVLRTGHLVEVDRSGLVGSDAGQTARIVEEVVTSALGGVLLIDEAYALTAVGHENDHGAEAIATLLKLMEDNPNDLAVIVAGYTAEMRLFLSANPGIRSRFSRFLEFPDYSADELAQIFDTICQQSSYALNDAGKREIRTLLQRVTARRDPGFGNADALRGYFEQAIAHHANRMAVKPSPTVDELTTLTDEDVQLIVA